MSLLLLALLLPTALCLPRTVTYDSRSFILSDTRTLLLSGSIHYQRIHPSDWPRVLSLAVENGLNTIQTYVQWDQHEPTPGSISFSSSNNLTAFTSLASSLGLHVIVRIGPYICGEHFNGGVPLWLRSPPTSAQCFRCSDPTWLAFSNHVLTEIVTQLTSASQLYPQGGPVIALQVENEYGGPDLSYLKTVVQQARALTTSVPWLLCHDLALCSAVNAASSAGSLGAALCTINGFWEDDSAEGVSQPSPAFMAGQRANNPHQPLAWTEDQGWFDQWGVAQRIRRTSDVLYGFARAVSLGLSMHNFYMFTGGSNFGLSAANGVTTAYAPDTAVDFLLLRHEPKFSTVAAFHGVLAAVAERLLAVDPPAPSALGRFCQVVAYGDVALLSNTGTNASASEVVLYGGLQWAVPNHTVLILQGTPPQLLFNTSAAPDFAAPAQPPVRQRSPPSWVTLQESIGYGNRSASPAAGAPPLEQLALTNNEVDYMSYTLHLSAPLNASTLTVTTCGGEYVYLYAGSAAAARLTSSSSPHTFALPRAAAAATPTTLTIVLSAMGLSTSPSPGSCKGLKHVRAGSTDLTTSGWQSSWVFAGEAARVYTPEGAAAAAWAPVDSSGGTAPLSWFKAVLDAPAPPPLPPGTPPQLAYALDLSGATKGVAYFNGFHLGRYNLELGVCSGPCAPPHHGSSCYIYFRACGQPTQRYYHVPTALVQASGNLVVLFEETATVPIAGQGPAQPSPPPPVRGGAAAQAPPGSTPRDLSKIALVALTEHP